MDPIGHPDRSVVSWEPSGFVRPCIWSTAGGPPLVVLESPTGIGYGFDLWRTGPWSSGTATSEGDGAAPLGRWRLRAHRARRSRTGPERSPCRTMDPRRSDTTRRPAAPPLGPHTRGAILRQMMIDAGYGACGVACWARREHQRRRRRIAGMAFKHYEYPSPSRSSLKPYSRRRLQRRLRRRACFDYLDFVALYDVQDPRASSTATRP